MAGSMDANFLKYLQGVKSGFQPYGAGNKRYGFSGAGSPHAGGGLDKNGYKERDLRKRALRNAMLRRLKAGQQGRLMSKDFLDPEARSY